MEILRNLCAGMTLFFAFTLSLILIVPRVEKKKYYIMTSVLMGVMIVLNIAAMFVFGFDAVNQYALVTLSLPSLIYFFCVSKYRDGRLFFIFCFGDVLTMALSYPTLIASVFFENSLWFLFISRIILFPLSAIIIAKYVSKFFHTAMEEITNGWWLMTAISLMFYIYIALICAYPTHIKERPADMPGVLLMIAIVVLTYITFFRLILNQLKIINFERTQKLMSVQMKSFENTIKTMELNEKQLRIIRHDLRHYENNLREIVNTGDMDAVRKFVDAAPEIAASVKHRKYCENIALNSVLFFYVQLANDAGCKTGVCIKIAGALPVKEAELCIVFANALENAINACKKIKDSAQRQIIITCNDNSQFVFEIANTYTGKISLNEAGIPITDKKNHGYGTQSIKAFAKKHNALLDYDIDEKWFKLRMAISSNN